MKKYIFAGIALLSITAAASSFCCDMNAVPSSAEGCCDSGGGCCDVPCCPLGSCCE